MKRIFLLLAAIVLVAAARPAKADDCGGSWIFQRSYYSHDPISCVRIADPAVHGGPYYTRPQGVFVRSGFRNLNSIIQMGPAGTDQTNVWESWVQTGAQLAVIRPQPLVVDFPDRVAGFPAS